MSNVELWRAGWDEPKPWPRDDINPPCSECGETIERYHAYRMNDRETYLMPGRIIGVAGVTPSPKRAHDWCLGDAA